MNARIYPSASATSTAQSDPKSGPEGKERVRRLARWAALEAGLPFYSGPQQRAHVDALQAVQPVYEALHHLLAALHGPNSRKANPARRELLPRRAWQNGLLTDDDLGRIAALERFINSGSAPTPQFNHLVNVLYAALGTNWWDTDPDPELDAHWGLPDPPISGYVLSDGRIVFCGKPSAVLLKDRPGDIAEVKGGAA